MKKLLIALPFVATASWAGTTLYSGSQTRTAYDDLVSQLDGMSAMKVSTESYTSGFAASSAITAVRASDAVDAPVLFRLRHDISHSPISLGGDGTRVGAARIVTTLVTDDFSDEAKAALERFDGEAPVTLASDVGFDGRVSNALSVAPLAVEEDGSVFEFGGLRYDFAIGADASVSGSGTFAGARLADADAGIDVRVAPGRDRFAYERVRKGVYTGEQEMTFGTVTITNTQAGLSVALDDVTLASSSSLDGERLDSGMTLAVGEIDSPLPLDAMSFGVRVGGIDVDGLERYIDGIGELIAADEASLAAMSPDELFGRIGELYAGLIAPGFSVDYDLSLSNAGGDVVANAGLVFEGDGSASGYDAMTTVGELVRALKLSATLEADADAIALTPAAMFLAGDQLAPWIVSDGTGYRSELGLDDLIVDVNGNPMSLELMAGGMLEMPLDPAMLMMMAGQGR